MEIQVNFVGEAQSSVAAIQEIERRVVRALDRVAHSVQAVRVSLRDINGPRGGVDQECVIALTPRRSGKLVVARALTSSRDESMFKSLKRVRRRFERSLETLRDKTTPRKPRRASV